MCIKVLSIKCHWVGFKVRVASFERGIDSLLPLVGLGETIIQFFGERLRFLNLDKFG